MFAGDQQLLNFKPTKVCDIISLLYVAYYFVEGGLPWTDLIDLRMEQNPDLNLYDLKNYINIRNEHSFHF